MEISDISEAAFSEEGTIADFIVHLFAVDHDESGNLLRDPNFAPRWGAQASSVRVVRIAGVDYRAAFREARRIAHEAEWPTLFSVSLEQPGAVRGQRALLRLFGDDLNMAPLDVTSEPARAEMFEEYYGRQ
ncbi:MAG: hypothetical protein V4737_14200 [Curtobacterium sp.]